MYGCCHRNVVAAVGCAGGVDTGGAAYVDVGGGKYGLGVGAVGGDGAAFSGGPALGGEVVEGRDGAELCAGGA